ncbi:FG-GAP-like repeat-containing protein, partial [bacterium]|nr:FG-GAP-like repeat-containing protein [bacterium]
TSFTFSSWTHGGDREDGVDFALADSTMLTVLSGADALGTLNAGTTGTAEVVVAVSPAARAGQIAPVDLFLTASAGGPWTLDTPLVFAGPELIALLGTVDDSGTPPTSGNGNGVAEPGETVRWTATARNRGNGAAPAVTGTLAGGAAIAITDGADAYGAIASGAQSSGTDGYVFTLLDSTATSVTVTLTDSLGRGVVQSIDFVPPAAPLDLASTSTEDAITLTWPPSPEGDLAGYRVYRSAVPGSGYALASPDELLRSGSRFVDQGLPLHSTFYYVTTAVDSSGNESPLSAEWKAWTVQAQLPGWPQNAGGNLFSSVGVVDVDRDGVDEAFVGSIDQHLHGWNGDGSRLVGFPAATTAEIWGTPAFGDLDRDGILDVVWGSRDAYLYAAHADGTPVVGDSLAFAPLQAEIRGTASLVDVDGDGLLEMFVGNDLGQIWAFRADGTGLTSPTGLFFTCPPGNSNARVWGTIAAADLAGDGQMRLVFASWNDSVYVALPDGTIAPGFPRAGLTDFRSGVSLGDLDADGTMEIIAGDDGGNLWVFDHDGSDYAYAPGGLLAALPAAIRSPIALANVDADPELELFVGALDGRLYALQHDGAGLLQPGGLFVEIDPNAGISASPIVVDVDGDSDFEIFVGHRNGTFYGFHHDGSVLAGFPFPTDLDIYATASAGDLDGDGDIEIAFASYDQFVRVLDFDGPSVPAAYEWPTYAGNSYRTGAYLPGAHSGTGVPAIGAPGPAFSLGTGMPNPFRGVTSIPFSLPRDGTVRLQVYDAAGRLVRTLRNGDLPAGRHVVTWDGRDGGGRATASGVYFYRLSGNAGSLTRKAVRLR